MDFINFKVGKNTVALNILDILLTEQYEDDLTALPNEKKGFLGIKEVMTKNVAVFDLGKILNQVSIKESNEKLIHWLKEAEQELVEWFYALEQSLEEGVPFIKSKDPQYSIFGRGSENHLTENEDLVEKIKTLERGHLHLYQMAKTLLGLLKMDKKQEAQSLFLKEKRSNYAKLLRLFVSLRDDLALDYKPIIVFTTLDGVHPNIGFLVDKVEDSVLVKEEDVQSLGEIIKMGFELDEQTKNLMSGLIKHNNKHCLILNPGAIFIEQKQMHDLEAQNVPPQKGVIQ